MRVHDINLVADLTAHDPNDPYPCDGTQVGVGDDTYSGSISALAIGFSFIEDVLQAWWTLEQYWPKYHVLLDFMFGPCNQVVHFKFDILGNRELVALTAGTDSSVNELLEYICDWVFAAIFAGLIQSAVVAINIFDMVTEVNPTNPYAGIALGAAVALTMIAYIAPITLIESQHAEGLISHGKAAAKYFALFAVTLGLLLGWKSLQNVLSATTSVLLGVAFGIHLMGAGIWAPWIEETYNWEHCRWGTLIILGALLIFGGLMVWHGLQSLYS